MSLLESVLNATQPQSPVVVSENNDLRSINWVNGLSDPGEMIACGAYQQLRRMSGESDAAYAARLNILMAELPEDVRYKIQFSMQNAAIRRAGLDTSTGKVAVMVAGKAAWHRLGVNVESAVNSADAIRLASLDWQVDKTALRYTDSLGTVREQKEVYAMVRRDTGAMLGSVGSRYTPIQNSKGFEFLDSVIGSFGAKYETAGAIYGGRKVWMLVKLPDHSFRVNGTDEMTSYALFTNPHDGIGSAYCYPTTERVVCANTFRVSLQDKNKGIAIRHTGNVDMKIDEAKFALGLSVDSMHRFAKEAESLAQTRLPDAEFYVNDVLNCVLDVTAADCEKGAGLLEQVLKVSGAERKLAERRFARKIEKRGEILTDILNRYESEKNGVAGMRGTAWAGFNAVTEFADHAGVNRFNGSDDDRESRRFESAVAGDGDDLKQIAFEKALAYRN